MIKLVKKVGADVIRSEAREKVMTILYQININKENKITYDIKELIKDNNADNLFITKIVNGVEENNEKLENIANQYLKDWTVKRLDKLGSIILKMAFYEIIYMDTPQIVVVNEAINLAKKYCDIELAKMINATLDSYLKEPKNES